MKTTLFLSLFMVSVAFGEVEIEDVTFGFNDGYKTGTWAPLTITVRDQDQSTMFAEELGVEVRSFSSDTPIQRYTTSLTGSRQKNFYVYCPKNATELVIELTPAPQSGNTISQDKVRRVMQEITLPTPIARTDYLVLVLAPSGDKLKRFIDKKQLAAHNDAQVHVAYPPNATSLPRDWIGYSAVDVLVIRERVLTERRISKAQQTAMLDWVQRGGTLIVSGGSNYKYLHHSFIEPFLPVELKAPEQTEIIPTVLHEQLGFESLGSNGSCLNVSRFLQNLDVKCLSVQTIKSTLRSGTLETVRSFVLRLITMPHPLAQAQKRNNRWVKHSGADYSAGTVNLSGISQTGMPLRSNMRRRFTNNFYQLLSKPDRLRCRSLNCWL